jgi:hypothetical protein
MKKLIDKLNEDSKHQLLYSAVLPSFKPTFNLLIYDIENKTYQMTTLFF